MIALVLALVLFAGTALAQEPDASPDTAPALARIDFRPPDTIWVGQRVSFYVEVLSATRFAENPQFDLPQVSGAILMRPPGSPMVAEKKIDGTTYTTQLHSFSVYPQRDGEIVVAPIEIRFRSTGDDKAGEPQRAATEELRFTARLPEGAEGLSVLISTKGLEVRETWTPQPSAAKVGDALTRKIVWKATDISGMAFPPLPEPEIEGIAVYPAEPEVRDTSNRGDLTGNRVDSMTFVFEKPGTYELPALVIPWFDLGDLQMKRIELPSLTLDVAENPNPIDADTDGEDEAATDGPPPAPGESLRTAMKALGFVLALGLLFGFAYRRFHEPIARHLAARREARAHSEAAYLERAIRSCGENNALASLNNILHWLDRAVPGSEAATIASFARTERGRTDEGRTLIGLMMDLERAVAAESSWSGGDLHEALRRFHKAAPAPDASRDGALPPLNPLP